MGPVVWAHEVPVARLYSTSVSPPDSALVGNMYCGNVQGMLTLRSGGRMHCMQGMRVRKKRSMGSNVSLDKSMIGSPTNFQVVSHITTDQEGMYILYLKHPLPSTHRLSC